MAKVTGEVNFTFLEPLVGGSSLALSFYLITHEHLQADWAKASEVPKREFLWEMHRESASVMWAKNDPLESKWHRAFLAFSC